MEVEDICGTCLRKGKPLVKECVGTCPTVVCPLCLASIKKQRAFQRQCVLAAQLLADYSSNHLYKNWDEYASAHKQQIEQIYGNVVQSLEPSNTLCLDIIPTEVDIEDKYTTQLTSYHRETKPTCVRNYCEGMVLISKDFYSKQKDTKKKKKRHNDAGQDEQKSVRKDKSKRRKKLKNKTTKRSLNFMKRTDSDDGFECHASDRDDDSYEYAVKTELEIETHNRDEDFINEQESSNKSVKINKKKVRKKHTLDDVNTITIKHDSNSTNIPEFEYMFVCRTNLTLEEQREEMEKRKVSKEFLSSPFKCNKCFIGFKFQYSLDNHMKKHTAASGSVVCVVCTQHFSSQNKLRDHTRLHHSQVLQCVICGKLLKERKRLRDHWEAHMGLTYTCDTCQKGFKTKTALVHHISIHNNKFHCPHCSLVLRSRPTFKKHLLLHSSVRPHACDSCPRTFATREWLELHTQRAHAPTTEQFYCVECDYRFKSNREYKKHLTAKKHTDPSLLIHSCSRCPRRYASQEELSRHMSALHDRVLSYSCPDCPGRFATTRGLYGHKRRVHMGYVAPKNYSCSYCNKAFRDKYYLTNHIRIHTGDTTHKCTLCLLTFTHASALTHHLKEAHKDGM